MLPNFSKLSLSSQEEEDTGAPKRRKEANIKPPRWDDSLAVKMALIPYIEPVIKGNWGYNLDRGRKEYLKKVKAASLGVDLKFGEFGIGIYARDQKDTSKDDYMFLAGDFIAYVSGVYYTREQWNTFSTETKRAIRHYEFDTGLRVVSKSDTSMLAGELREHDDALEDTHLFRGLKMTSLHVAPRFQTTLYDDETGIYVKSPHYNSRDSNVPMMWDPYVQGEGVDTTTKQGRGIVSELDIAYYANHIDASSLPKVEDADKRCENSEQRKLNAAVRPFLVKARDDNEHERIVMVMFSTCNIRGGEEILVDYGYDPTEPETDEDYEPVKTTRLGPDTVDSVAIRTSCLRDAGMRTLLDMRTEFYDSETRAATCLFKWPKWHPRWPETMPLQRHCGPRVAALQVGFARSFSLLLAYPEDSNLQAREWDRLIMRGGEYVSTMGVDGTVLETEPYWRSWVVKFPKQLVQEEFGEDLAAMAFTVVKLDQLAEQCEDAYQKTVPRGPEDRGPYSPYLPEESATDRCKTLLDFYKQFETFLSMLFPERADGGETARDDFRKQLSNWLQKDVNILKAEPLLDAPDFGLALSEFVKPNNMKPLTDYIIAKILGWFSNREESTQRTTALKTMLEAWRNYRATHYLFFPELRGWEGAEGAEGEEEEEASPQDRLFQDDDIPYPRLVDPKYYRPSSRDCKKSRDPAEAWWNIYDSDKGSDEGGPSAPGKEPIYSENEKKPLRGYATKEPTDSDEEYEEGEEEVETIGKRPKSMQQLREEAGKAPVLTPRYATKQPPGESSEEEGEEYSGEESDSGEESEDGVF